MVNGDAFHYTLLLSLATESTLLRVPRFCVERKTDSISAWSALSVVRNSLHSSDSGSAVNRAERESPSSCG